MRDVRWRDIIDADSSWHEWVRVRVGNNCRNLGTRQRATKQRMGIGMLMFPVVFHVIVVVGGRNKRGSWIPCVYSIKTGAKLSIFPARYTDLAR